MLKVLSLAFEKNAQPQVKSAFTASTQLSNLFNSPQQSDLVHQLFSGIEALLTDEERRPDGLLELSVVLPQCSSNVFTSNAVMWMHFCCETIKGNFPSKTKNLACSVTIAITYRLSEFSAMQKEMVDRFLSVSVTAVLGLSFREGWLSSGLNLLSSLMSVYKHSCIKHLNEIKEFLMKNLEELNYDDIHVLATCFANLPMISSSQNQYATTFRAVISHLYEFHDQISSKLYKWFISGERDSNSVMAENSDPESLVTLTNDSRRQQATVQCLIKMFGYTRVPVEINISSRLNHIEMSLNYRPVYASNSDMMYFETIVLPNMQITALMLLENLVSNFHHYLTCSAMSIANMIRSLLYFVSYQNTNRIYSERVCRKIRCLIYKVLHVWMQKMHPILSQDWLVDVFKSMEKDICVSSVSSSSYSLRISNETQPDDSMERTVFPENSEACILALKVLSAMFTTSDLSESQFIVEIGAYIQRIFKVLRLHFVAPYDDPLSRVELYGLLQCITISRKVSGNILSFAVKIFENGKMDPDGRVSSMCVTSSNICGVVLSSINYVTVPEPRPRHDFGASSGEDVMHYSMNQQAELAKSKMLISNVLEGSSKCKEEENEYDQNEGTVMNGMVPPTLPVSQKPEHERPQVVKDERECEELDYTYDDDDEEEEEEEEDEDDDEEEDEEEECDPSFNSYTNSNSKPQKRTREQYEDDEEAEDEDAEEDEEEEFEEEDDNFEEEYEQKCEEEASKDNRHTQLLKKTDISIPESNHISEFVERDNLHLSNTNSKHSRSPVADSTSNNDSMPPLLINENGVNSCASEENAEYEMPAKKIKRFHDGSNFHGVSEGDHCPVVPTSIQAPANNQVSEGIDVESMLADFVDCSPDADETSPE